MTGEAESGPEGLLLPGGKVDPEAVRRAFEALAGEDEGELPRVTFRLQRDLRSRLDRYLTSRISFMSRSRLQRLIAGGGVTVNGRAGKASTNLRGGDEVVVVLPPPPDTRIRPEEIPLDVLYEDGHIIVLNKRADIIVHPARSELSGTMVNALAWHFEHASAHGGELSAVGEEFARPGVVHRLDRHTSGCIVFAKTEEAHWKLGRQFEARTVDKRYLAVVHGRVRTPSGEGVWVIDLPIGPHPSREKGHREKYVVRHDELGKPSVTILRVRERYRSGAGDEYTLVELELKTGRTHQIRVHLSHNGHPIVGDDMYGGRPYVDAAGRTVIDRQALHAATLGFRHPITGEALCFTAPLRAEIGGLVRTLRAESGGALVAENVPGATVDLGEAVA